MKQIILTIALALGLVGCYVEPHGYTTIYDDHYYSPYPYNPYRYYDVPFSYRIYSAPRVIVPRPQHKPLPPRRNSLYPQYSPRPYNGSAPIRTFPKKKH